MEIGGRRGKKIDTSRKMSLAWTEKVMKKVRLVMTKIQWRKIKIDEK